MSVGHARVGGHGAGDLCPPQQRGRGAEQHLSFFSTRSVQ
jgi:hypothetical protein